MKIGLMGFDFTSPNKGCEALTYSFISMLMECFGEDIQVVNYSYGELGAFPQKFPSIKFVLRHHKMKNPLNWIKIKREMAELDIIFDITFGDGFSDIYGKTWNCITDMMKQLAIDSRRPLVLLPQTYGPFKNSFLKKWATLLVNNSYAAYSRDVESAAEMNKECDNKIKVITDLAFALPYNKSSYNINNENINIGINVSSLLWDSDYAKHNKFDLKVDYKSYIYGLIDALLEDEKKVIHLIPHVVDTNNYSASENDVRPCKEVKIKYSENKNVVCAPSFSNPIDAKSYISNMDVFVGARMHATIGALSAGVATIPVAYSKKFKTMFGNLNYQYLIDAREMDTNLALEQSLCYINESNKLTEKAKLASKRSMEELSRFKKDIRKLSEISDIRS